MVVSVLWELRIPWLSVNQTRLSRLVAVPRPLFALDVQRAGMPGVVLAS
jgi:hypothetical protein